VFGLFARFKILSQIWRTGRLALRLVRDPRVPIAAKLIFGATVVYILSPIDIVPDWLPFVGQADDVVALLTGLNLFLRACPGWLVEEHEDAIDGRRGRTQAAEPFGAGAPASGPTVDAPYQRVR
jgi:uncharacterized membrane protein YkvA (DUF1232 family)